MENYEININTLAIIPINRNKSKIIEIEKEYIVNKKSTEIIDNSCKYFGSSYKGRFEGTKEILGVSYKSPIIIEETRDIIFFPTTSPRYEGCNWICLNNIEDYKKNEYGTIINFKNGLELKLDMSLGSFENQMIRAMRLSTILKRRKII